MKSTVYPAVRAVALASLLSAAALGAVEPPRIELSADAGWKFHLGEAGGAEEPSFSDESWRNVDLPHDWSIEGRPEESNSSGRGGGYFPAGIGWYRRTFDASAEWQGKRVNVEFDGVYRDATVYLNGHELGSQPFGYTSFRFNLTPHLDYSRPNVLAVRVDNSAQPNSRWYSGSGIYRHVCVVVTEPAYVAHWGVFVTTPEVTRNSATVAVRTRLQNESSTPVNLTLQTTLLDEAGAAVGDAQSAVSLVQGDESETDQQIEITAPKLWSPDTPRLYRAVTRVVQAGDVVDEVVTTFGIRSIEWSAERGFLLNGESIKIAGGNVHHDHGPLGAASFDRAEERKAELLKAAGYNAVRTSHNPYSPAFLDACDRVGLLVFDDSFDVWEAGKEKFDYSQNFRQWWVRDLTAMIKRDRNHPSVVMWGIGNEIPELTQEKGAAMAQELIAQVRALDGTRAISLSYPGKTFGPTQNAVFSQLDIVGYNYNLAKNHEADHSRLPERIMITTESFPADAFQEWSLAQDHPYIVGEFVWTAMDYLGESGIGAVSYGSPELAAMAGGLMSNMSVMADQFMTATANGVDFATQMAQSIQSNPNPNAAAVMGLMMHGFPWHAAACGDIDLIGYRKPQSYYRDILWNGGDRVYAAVRPPAPDGQQAIAVGWAVLPTEASWTWPGQEGKELTVEVYSGAERVRLYLNGTLVGEEPTGREQQFKALFTVPYEPGELKAVGLRRAREVAESLLVTAGDAVRLRLTADRSNVMADGQDLSFVTVEAVDVLGRAVPNAPQEIEFTISGPGAIAGVGNADGKDMDSHSGNRRKLFQGRAQVIVRTSDLAGSIQLTAKTPGLEAAIATIQSKNVPSPQL